MKKKNNEEGVVAIQAFLAGVWMGVVTLVGLARDL
jgi:hypothetical protein